jgi:hypothetical protein
MRSSRTAPIFLLGWVICTITDRETDAAGEIMKEKSYGQKKDPSAFCRTADWKINRKNASGNGPLRIVSTGAFCVCSHVHDARKCRSIRFLYVIEPPPNCFSRVIAYVIAYVIAHICMFFRLICTITDGKTDAAV